MCLTGLGVSALDRRDPIQAAALYEEDIRILQQLKDKTGTVYGLRGMACVSALRGEAARAARLWGAAEALGENIRLPLSAFDRSHPDYERLIDGVRSRLDDEAAWEAAREEGQAMTPEEALEYALATEEAAPASPEKASALSSLLSAPCQPFPPHCCQTAYSQNDHSSPPTPCRDSRGGIRARSSRSSRWTSSSCSPSPAASGTATG